MERFPAILIVLNETRVKESLVALNPKTLELKAVLVQDAENAGAKFGEAIVPLHPFTAIRRLLNSKQNFLWLLSGSREDVSGIERIRHFLVEEGVPEKNIINCVILPHLNRAWLGNLKRAESAPIDFFAIGGITLDLARLNGVRGVNLADQSQDLRQSLQTARHVFERQQSIKFALITLAPHSFRYDNRADFENCSKNIQYMLALNQSPESNYDKFFLYALGERVRHFVESIAAADLETQLPRDVSLSKLADWKETLENLNPPFRAETIENNLAALEQFIELCRRHDAKPIGIIPPLAPIISRHLSPELLFHFRQTLRRLEEHHGFEVIDLFDLPLDYDCFVDGVHLNARGAERVSELLELQLQCKDVVPRREMLETSYGKFFELSMSLDTASHVRLMEEQFSAAEAKIRQKDRIKLGFVLYDAAMWSGDLLYDLFNRNERYEPSVFLCLRRDESDSPTVVRDFRRGIEQFQSRGINVTGIDDFRAEVPKQDVLIYLTPYLQTLPRAFRLGNLSTETLIAYIPYGMHVSGDAHVRLPDYEIINLAWKVFLDTRNTLEYYDRHCRFGLPRGMYSGYPRMDYFFRDAQPSFEWKELLPRSTKIIYAPHWSIDRGIRYSTFHLNHRFMYEYAKAHPKTSWVFKPHPNLLFSAVKSGLLSSAGEFESYLRAWNALPNARVVTGSNFGEIFASSDGMIHDGGSFNAEYQYTHKPLLFLTRETQKFSTLGEELMRVLYRADGRDHKAIASFIDNVLIKKRDPMAEARKKFFDEHFNYRQDNGMLASECIFKAIDQQLRR